MNQNDGYARWAARAQTMGQAAAWKPWTEDESCPQRDVARDEIAPIEQTAFCALESGGGGGCTDRFEPNDDRGRAVTVAAGTFADVRVCSGDRDWFKVAAARTVRITFSHAAGDLDLTAYDAAGTRVGQSAGTGDSEQVMVPAGGTVEIFGYSGATGGYTLIIQ
jgi:hypothetical protein